MIFSLAHLSFLSEILRVACSQTQFTCHSINQKLLLMARLRVCDGTVIYVHNNSLEVAWVPTGTVQGKIKPRSVYRRLPKSVAVASSRPERSGSIRNTGGEEGAGEAAERPQESVSQAPAGLCFASLLSCLILSSSPRTPLSEDGL